MSVKVYGINHIAIEVDDIEKAVEFYQDVFDLEKLDEGEGDAFFRIGEHQFLAMFEARKTQPNRTRQPWAHRSRRSAARRSAGEADNQILESN